MRYRVRLTTSAGTHLYWHKGGKLHSLDERLAPVWAQNFKPQIFQVSPAGELVPRGTSAALDITQWDLEPEA